MQNIILSHIAFIYEYSTLKFDPYCGIQSSRILKMLQNWSTHFSFQFLCSYHANVKVTSQESWCKMRNALIGNWAADFHSGHVSVPQRDAWARQIQTTCKSCNFSRNYFHYNLVLTSTRNDSKMFLYVCHSTPLFLSATHATLRAESPSIFPIFPLPDFSRKIEGDSARRVYSCMQTYFVLLIKTKNTAILSTLSILNFY